MLRYALFATAAFLLTACAGIAHDTPEARQQIKRDLKLQEIYATATTSYCWFPFGLSGPCRATPGIAVLATDKLLLVDYAQGAYKQDAVLMSKDIRCITEGDGRMFYVFTDNGALMVMPYASAGTEWNPVFRDKAIKTLLSEGQPYLTGAAAHFVRDSGKTQYNVSTLRVNGMAIPMVTTSSVMDIYSPCSNKQG